MKNLSLNLSLLTLLAVVLLPGCGGGSCCKKSCADDTCKTQEFETRSTEDRKSGPMQDGIDFEDEDLK